MAKTNGELKIEKGIPIPSGNANVTATLRKLKVGDSVLLPSSFDRQYAHQVLGKGNYTARKMEDGVRVWRTK